MDAESAWHPLPIHCRNWIPSCIYNAASFTSKICKKNSTRSPGSWEKNAKNLKMKVRRVHTLFANAIAMLTRQEKSVVDKNATIEKFDERYCINEVAFQLFFQVDVILLWISISKYQSIAKFRVAAKVFWVSHSVWVRACPKTKIRELLQWVIKRTGKHWFDQDECVYVWFKEHDRVAKFYVEKVMLYTDILMNSAAGKKLEERVLYSRKRNGAIPEINWKTITNFDGAEGLNWKMKDTCDFFSILSEVTPTSIIHDYV